MPDIHPTAIVDPRAEIADSASIGAYVLVGPSCVVGEQVDIQPFARLVSHVTLESEVKVHTGAIIGDIPQHLAYEEHPGRVFVGQGATLRERVTIHRPHVEGGETRVGARCFLMVDSHVAHDVTLEDEVTLVNNATIGGHAHIERQATLSSCVLIHQFCRVGRLVMISGGGQMTVDVPPFCMMGGRNVLHGLNIVGLRRAGFTPGQRKELKRAFGATVGASADLRRTVPEARERLADAPEEDRAAALELIEWLERDHPRGVVQLAGG